MLGTGDTKGVLPAIQELLSLVKDQKSQITAVHYGLCNALQVPWEERGEMHLSHLRALR